MTDRKNPHQFVSVGSSGDEFLTIETNCLSGAPIGEREEQTIRWAIGQLCGFLGDGATIACESMTKDREYLQRVVDEAIKAEREECAKIADTEQQKAVDNLQLSTAYRVAIAIRERNNIDVAKLF